MGCESSIHRENTEATLKIVHGLKVSPLNQLWVQVAEGEPHNLSDCTLTIDPYGELPRYLRKLVTYQEVSGFAGKGHAEKETLLENGVIFKEGK